MKERALRYIIGVLSSHFRKLSLVHTWGDGNNAGFYRRMSLRSSSCLTGVLYTLAIKLRVTRSYKLFMESYSIVWNHVDEYRTFRNTREWYRTSHNESCRCSSPPCGDYLIKKASSLVGLAVHLWQSQCSPKVERPLMVAETRRDNRSKSQDESYGQRQ